MQIVAGDQLHRRADQRQRARWIVLREVHRPLGQRQLGQEPELAQVALGLSEAGELDLRHAAQGLHHGRRRRIAHQERGVDRPREQLLDRLVAGQVHQHGRRPVDLVRLQQLQRQHPRAAALRSDRQSLALELRQHLDRLGAAAVDHQRLRVHAAQRHQVRQVAALGQPALHETDVDPDRLVREPVQVVERAARLDDLDLHAVTREALLVLLRLVSIAAAGRAAGEADRLRWGEAGRLHRHADGRRRDQDRRQADDDQIAPRRRRDALPEPRPLLDVGHRRSG